MKNFKLELDLITDICEQQLGLEVGTLNTKTKTKDLVLGRMVVSNILMDGGVTPTKLSDHYVQHRTCFYHYGKLHKQNTTSYIVWCLLNMRKVQSAKCLVLLLKK